jgi:hypothetical protein
LKLLGQKFSLAFAFALATRSISLSVKLWSHL